MFRMIIFTSCVIFLILPSCNTRINNKPGDENGGQRKALEERRISRESIIIVSRKKMAPYTVTDNTIPLTDSLGCEKEMRQGEAIFKMKKSGQRENVLGVFDVYKFSFVYKLKEIFSADDVYGASLPSASVDSAWFSICLTTEAAERDSRQSLFLIDTKESKSYLMDSNIYAQTNAPILKVADKTIMFYMNGYSLKACDVTSKKIWDIGVIQYADINEEQENAYIYKLSELEFIDGRISGKMIFHFGEEYKSGFFSFQFVVPLTVI